jgi:hypothetical protein
VSIARPKRAGREAYLAAARVFGAAGFTCEMVWGGKHLLCVARRDEVEIRIPLSGTPRGGVTSAVNMAESTARKRLLRLATP